MFGQLVFATDYNRRASVCGPQATRTILGKQFMAAQAILAMGAHILLDRGAVLAAKFAAVVSG